MHPSQAQLNRFLPIDWRALYRLHSLAAADKHRALQTVYLLTLSETVNRFGFPTRVLAERRLVLAYLRYGADGKVTGFVRFHLLDGYVAYFESSLT